MTIITESAGKLAELPLLWTAATISVYALFSYIYSKKKKIYFHPVFTSIAALIVILLITGTPYAVYNEGGKYISFFLGPSVVALAVPLYKERELIRKNVAAIGITLPLGALIGIVTAIVPMIICGASSESIRSIAPKSITTPIAMGVSEVTGGFPNLTAAIVVFTGLFGAVAGPVILRGIGLAESAVFGFAMGFSSHGIGTARAFEYGDTSGAFSSLALCLNGIATAILTPPVLMVLERIGALPPLT